MKGILKKMMIAAAMLFLGAGLVSCSPDAGEKLISLPAEAIPIIALRRQAPQQRFMSDILILRR